VNSIIPDYLLDGLNEPQQKIVQFKDGPLLVLAGPGSGKTRVVTHRIAALLHQGVGASQIAALTFTNKAADEMKNRLAFLAPNRNIWIGTFHKFCSYLLRRYIGMVGLQPNFTIYDTDESLALLKTIAEKNSLPPGVTVQRISASISWAKNNRVLSDAYVASEGSLLGKVVEEVYPAYQDALRLANAVDFDDLLLHIMILLQGNPEVRKILDNRFRYILVDEYQDTNTVQYVIAKALSIDHRNLTVTGDPDQSIYSWRGATIKNILDFEKDFPDTKIIRLEQNYRSTPQILAVADALIENNIYRKKKRLVAKNSSGKPVRLVRCFDQKEEAESIAKEIAEEIRNGKRKPNDYAIFYRMNVLSRNFEHALRTEKIPFQLIRGLEFFNRKEVKDVIAYLRVIYNPSDTVSLARIINEPVRGIGKTTLKKLTDQASQFGITTMDAARDVSNFSNMTSKTKKSVAEFVKLIDRLADAASKEYPIESLIGMVLQESGYREQYTFSETKEDLERLENIEELLTVAREFDTSGSRPSEPNTFINAQALVNEHSLSEFLEQVALVNDVDGFDKDVERVSLMTLHAAKGLEFPVVYIVALEEGILPHERSQDDQMQLEEERRLFFVGITRAKEELRLSRVGRRSYRNLIEATTIFSRFLAELPDNSNTMIRYDSPANFLDSEDCGDGIRLVREKQPKYGDDTNIENTIDIEYVTDIEYDEEPILRQHVSRKTETPKKFSIITAAELLRQQEELE
jgi:DNA helicase-2/ATP-dependent DNA helicase PcrA